jgi:hypothetical protein
MLASIKQSMSDIMPLSFPFLEERYCLMRR